MKIKYNPILAASIMYAILEFLWATENGTKEEDISFVADDKVKEPSPLAFWQEKKGKSPKGGSCFNVKTAPILIFATDNETSTWRRNTDAPVVQMAMILQHCILTPGVCKDLGFRMSAQPKTQGEFVDKMRDQYMIFTGGHPVVQLLASGAGIVKAMTKFANDAINSKEK